MKFFWVLFRGELSFLNSLWMFIFYWFLGFYDFFRRENNSQIGNFVFVLGVVLSHICNVIGRKYRHQQSKIVESNFCEFKFDMFMGL